MPSKAQHHGAYRPVAQLLRTFREEAHLTQRELGLRLGRPQSWVYNCETRNRRVDLAEFCQWCVGCGVEPVTAVKRFLKLTEKTPRA